MRLFKTCLATLALLAALPLVQAQTPTPAKRDWFIFLETGKPTPPDKEAVQAMQRGHIANFEKLFAEGRLFAAGPLRDPSRLKRGIVVVKAADRDELTQMFQPDEYVREGYMTLNAEPAVIHQALHTEGIDVKNIEENRIILVSRPAQADAATVEKSRAFLRGLLAAGKVGAWYAPQGGPIADILVARTTDTAALEAAFAAHPDLQAGTATLSIWGQWLARGVVR